MKIDSNIIPPISKIMLSIRLRMFTFYMLFPFFTLLLDYKRCG